MRTAQVWRLAALIGQTLATNLNLTSLRGVLSSQVEILLPGTSEFNQTAARWSSLAAPEPNVVVIPATAEDVVQTVLFANQHDMPFLATNGAHGSITTLGRMTGGIEIYMPGLSNISIAADGQTVTVGGGVRSKNLTDALWEAGKQTVTGTCECVGYLGPALGGGHGWLQGRYGLVSDQFEAFEVVLASGQQVQVTAASDPDLFWALRGAGHNFGIVTSVTARIHDRTASQWALHTVVFSGEMVEQVYHKANHLWLPDGVSTQDDDFVNWSYWYYDPSTDAQGPVVVLYLMQEGVDAVDAAYYEPFADLEPISSSASNGTYLDLASWTGIDLAATPCQKTGNANPRFPVYLKAYNTTAIRQAYDLFSAATTEADSPFAGALFMFEGYAQQGVKAAGESSTAFAYRADNILAAPLLTYTPNGQALEDRAYTLGNEIRDVLWAGRQEDAEASSDAVHSYINYAYGDESPANWYGDEVWRQDKLQALKCQYDPHGRFSFYGPIACDTGDDGV